jgi:hypothetical protein
MILRRCLPLLVVLSSAACVVAPPAVSLPSEHGVIRADSLQAAEELAASYDRAYEQVQQRLPALRSVKAEVWQQQQLAYYTWKPLAAGVGGFAMRRKDRIHVIPSAEPQRSQILAHELVHLLRTDAWDVLPPYVEEGLCDTVAFEVEPYQAYRLRAQRLVHALRPWYTVTYDQTTRSMGLTLSNEVVLPRADIVPIEALAADRETFARYRRDEQPGDPVYRGLGYVVASRIVARHGYDGLYELCRRSVREGHRWLPADWLLEAAGLVDEPAAWKQAALEALGPQERASLLIASNVVQDDGSFTVYIGAAGVLDDREVERLQSRLRVDDETAQLLIERSRRWFRRRPATR